MKVLIATNQSPFVFGGAEAHALSLKQAVEAAGHQAEILSLPFSYRSEDLQRRVVGCWNALSVDDLDISDVEVGENIGARLQADQAEADTRVARAKAEERRAVAIAHEQEMKAATAENRAGVLKAEALVPKSIGEALRAGRMQSQSGNGQV